MKPFTIRCLIAICAAAAGIWILAGSAETASQVQAAASLRPPSAFESIQDQRQRSIEFFREAGKVLLHQRCVNCHPAGDRPRQGDDRRLHMPWVQRGQNGFGVAGMRCWTCHQEQNIEAAKVPGSSAWHLAPASMAWEGKTLAQVCEQIKDPSRNGNRNLEQIVEHMAKDDLVGWAWNPGSDLEPPPGTWKGFADLITAWAESGAACPQ